MTAAATATANGRGETGGPDAGAEAAAGLDALVDQTPELHPVRAELRLLAQALRSGTDDGWSDMDVVRIFDNAGSVGTVSHSRRSWRAWLEEAPSVLVFFPVLVTWLGLAAATVAYGRMLGDPATRGEAEGRSFLQLWQEGFAGKLPSVFNFGHMSVVALAAIGLLVGVTVAGVVVRRRDETARSAAATAVRDRLRASLIRAQLVLNRRRLASPARFAAELSQAAQRLGELLSRTGAAQRSTASLADRNANAAERLTASITELRGAVTQLELTGGEIRSATDTLQSATNVLREDLTTRAAAAATRLETATGSAVSRMDTSSDRVAAQVASLRTTAEATLQDAAGRIDQALAGVADRIEASTDALREAGRAYAQTVADSSRQASVDIGQFYGEAVATAAVSLASRMAQIGADLNAAVRSVRDSAETNARSVRDTGAVLTALATKLTEATAAIDETAGRIEATVARQADAAVTAGEAAPDPIPTGAPAAAPTDEPVEFR